MVVRFLPTAAQPPHASERDGGELAEVIQLRTRLTANNETANSEKVTTETVTTETVITETAVPSVTTERSTRNRAHSTSLNEDVYEDAVRLLARKARSSGELRRDLIAKEHDPIDVDAVVLKCEASLYLDDLGLARVVCETLRERKRASRTQIRRKLRERLFADGVIEEVVSELDAEAETELLRDTAEQRAARLSGLDRQTAERRLVGFLARRGWSGEQATRIAREALDRASVRGAVRFR